MSELSRKVLHASRHVGVELGTAELEVGLSKLERRIEQKRRRARAATALAALGAVALLWAALARDRATELVTRDGSSARAIAEDTALVLERESSDEVVVALSRGAGHFEVTRNRARRYRVRAGAVTVQVLGTAFDVRRRGEQVFVRVDHGAVQVDWPDGSTVLHGGDERWFPPPQRMRGNEAQAAQRVATPRLPAEVSAEPSMQKRAEPSAERSDVRARVRASERRNRAPVAAPSASLWRELARAGKHHEAFRTLGESPVEDVDGLLLAADAARLSGHPREAAQHLTRLVERYPRDVRARLAAFTLGRLALNELDQPLLAAESFARAYALDPTGELADDALSRQAEAYHRAGDARRAARVAEEYLERFPGGARRKELERYLGPR